MRCRHTWTRSDYGLDTRGVEEGEATTAKPREQRRQEEIWRFLQEMEEELVQLFGYSISEEENDAVSSDCKM